MTDTLNTRRPLVRVVVLLMLIGLGLRFIQVAAGDAPPAQAAQTTGAHELLRVEWLDACGQPAAVGLYRLEDAPCRPARQATAAWLQSQLAAAGLLQPGEFLQPAAASPGAGCGAEVLSATGAPAGWLCADPAGLYRIDPAGGPNSSRWQMWADGQWVAVQP